MDKCKLKGLDLVKQLVPEFSNIRFVADIFDNGYSIEFFVEINGELFQNFQLVEIGRIDETKMNLLFEEYAEYIRTVESYRTGEFNTIEFSELL